MRAYCSFTGLSKTLMSVRQGSPGGLWELRDGGEILKYGI